MFDLDWRGARRLAVRLVLAALAVYLILQTYWMLAEFMVTAPRGAP